jgi:translation initiation factor 1 (eIF-1/SUI1)
MYKYNVQIQKVSGSLNESSMPNKNLVVKSKSKKTDKEVFAEASKYYKEKYGLVIESADVQQFESQRLSPELVQKCKEISNKFNNRPDYKAQLRNAISMAISSVETIGEWAECATEGTVGNDKVRVFLGKMVENSIILEEFVNTLKEARVLLKEFR